MPSNSVAERRVTSQIRAWVKNYGTQMRVVVPLWICALVVGLGLGTFLYFEARFVLGSRIGSVNVEGLDRAGAVAVLRRAVEDYQMQWPATVMVDGMEKDFIGPESVTFLIDQSVDQAQEGMGLSLDTIWRILKGESVRWPLMVRLNEQSLESWFNETEQEIGERLVETRVVLEGGKVSAEIGTAGRAWNTEHVIEMIEKQLRNLAPLPVGYELEVQQPITDEQVINQAIAELTKWAQRELVLEWKDTTSSKSWRFEQESFVNWYRVGSGIDTAHMTETIQEVAQAVDREPVNAVFTENQITGRVEAFEPAMEGMEVDQPGLALKLAAAMDRLVQENVEVVEIQVPVRVTKPQVSLETINDYGITTLIGRGESTYVGSIPSRVYNVSLAAERISGYMVPPGEVFSFNDSIGEISQATGYRQAYVIYQGKTVLGDGGGVCQDSTTVFRAALDAGLPIVERKPHSYRVSYYEQNVKAGLDATVYPPYADLKFLNDTPSHILIQARADSERQYLVVDIYGTDDGRRSEILNHSVWGITPPPPDVWIDDPTLAPGKVVQDERAIAGARASFDYKVWRGETLLHEETFVSIYRPWAAVYRRGI